MNVVVVDVTVCLSSAGVRAIATKKPTKFATMLIRPQLMVSPILDGVYITASSYATKSTGRRKKPIIPHATRSML